MQARRPVAALRLSRRECLLAFPAAATLEHNTATRPINSKVLRHLQQHQHSCQASLIWSTSAAGFQYYGYTLTGRPGQVFASSSAAAIK